MPVWLGRRFTRAASGRYDVLVIVFASFVASLIVAGIAAVPGVIQAQRNALAAQLPAPSTTSTGMVANYARLDWRDHWSIDLIRVAREDPGTSAVVFPGLSRLPDPGEVALSPELARALSQDPELARAFPGRRVGDIDAGALVNSQQKLAVIGVSPRELRAGGTTGPATFGVESADFVLHPTSQTIMAICAVIGLVLLPVTAFLAGAAGQLAGTRATRAALLEAIGVTRRRARWLVRSDALLAALIGASVAMLVFPVLTRLVTHVPGLPMSWTSGQAQLTPAGVVAAYLLPVVAISGAAVRDQRTAGRSVPRIVLVTVGVLCLSGAFVGLVATRGARAFDSQSVALAVAGTLFALVVGAALLIEPAISLLAHLGLRRSPGPTRLLAAARLARSRSAAGRASGWVVAAFLFALAVSPIITATAPYDQVTEQAIARTGRVVAFVEPMPPTAAIEALRNSTEVTGTLIPTGGDETYVGDCATIRLLFAIEDCIPGERYDPSQFSRELQAGWENFGSYTVVAGTESEVSTALREAPQEIPAPLVLLTPNAQTYWALAGDVLARSPTSAVYANTGGLIGGANQLATRVQAWVRAGLIWSLLLAGALFCLGMAGDMTDRLRTERALRSLGVAEASVRRGLLAEQGVRILAIALFTVPLGVLVARISPAWLNRDAVPASWVGTCVVALGAVLLSGTFVALVASRLIRQQGHYAADASMLGE